MVREKVSNKRSNTFSGLLYDLDFQKDFFILKYFQLKYLYFSYFSFMKFEFVAIDLSKTELILA